MPSPSPRPATCASSCSIPAPIPRPPRPRRRFRDERAQRADRRCRASGSPRAGPRRCPPRAGAPVSLVAVVGECSTTTAVALAATWPAGERVIVAELDPAGGSLAAWLDVPRAPNLSELVASADAGAGAAVEGPCPHPASGPRVLVAPGGAVAGGAARGG